MLHGDPSQCISLTYNPSNYAPVSPVVLLAGRAGLGPGPAQHLLHRLHPVQPRQEVQPRGGDCVFFGFVQPVTHKSCAFDRRCVCA